ncbi:hypothetical protein CLOBOL_06675 [Enterocloster bolteae ATCC BAA-613]|uniref:Uncharacterized protein n=1 Tax=Enterocloster bolteae (strain ATCC BAA-613 / DSM 15670 / CCUG 46953 / JCM 12243 / WAL 16351) TaxID=411902 RepID=A8S3N4_ENTBW|nr:hypothetical protein CLOBOL_06675 [Enterocloster bolteae ATCC BAA-613]
MQEQSAGTIFKSSAISLKGKIMSIIMTSGVNILQITEAARLVDAR